MLSTICAYAGSQIVTPVCAEQQNLSCSLTARIARLTLALFQAAPQITLARDALEGEIASVTRFLPCLAVKSKITQKRRNHGLTLGYIEAILILTTAALSAGPNWTLDPDRCQHQRRQERSRRIERTLAKPHGPPPRPRIPGRKCVTDGNLQ
jgi:hypothetical protein